MAICLCTKSNNFRKKTKRKIKNKLLQPSYRMYVHRLIQNFKYYKIVVNQ